MAKDELNTRQRHFIAAMMTAKTIRAAAVVVGVTERCARLWLALPIVKRALTEAQTETLGQATRQAVGAMTDALDTLTTLHKDDTVPPGARVSAARSVLEVGVKFSEVLDLAERVTTLEQKMEVESNE